MNIPKDKLQHFAVGFVLSFVTSWIDELLGVSVAFGWGWWKETEDAKDPANHSVEVNDLAATVAGGIMGALAVRVVRY